MTWVLFLCIIGADGKCAVTKEWHFPKYSSCATVQQAARIEPSKVTVEVGQATAVDISPGTQVVLICRPKTR